MSDLRAQVEQMLKAPVPPTIATDDHFRDIYCQGYRHGLMDVLRLSLSAPTTTEKEHDVLESSGDTEVPARSHGGVVKLSSLYDLQHGVNCDKAPHVGVGHLHGADDDRPYDVDGVSYCGRCHVAL